MFVVLGESEWLEKNYVWGVDFHLSLLLEQGKPHCKLSVKLRFTSFPFFPSLPPSICPCTPLPVRLMVVCLKWVAREKFARYLQCFARKEAKGQCTDRQTHEKTDGKMDGGRGPGT